VTEGTSIDWEGIHRRAQAAATHEASPEELAQIFEERARLLATGSEERRAQEGQALFRFTLGQAQLAVDLGVVRTIVVPRWTTEIPGAPAHLSRVAHIGGRLVSLLRLDLYMGIGRVEQEPAKYLLLESEGRRLGVAATTLVGIEEMDLSGLTLAGQATGGELLRGVTSDMTLVLDGERLVSELRVGASTHNGDE
jgi:chemotaxis signal transduction protein